MTEEVTSSETDPLAGIRQSVWQIPRNFLDLSHVVIGRGRFGSVIKGRVNNRGAEDAAIVQVVPGKIMDEREMREMAKEVRSIHIIKCLSFRSIGAYFSVRGCVSSDSWLSLATNLVHATYYRQFCSSKYIDGLQGGP